MRNPTHCPRWITAPTPLPEISAPPFLPLSLVAFDAPPFLRPIPPYNPQTPMETPCSIAADHPDHLRPRRLSNIGSARESQCRPVRPVKLFHSRLGEYGVAQSGGKRRQERTEWRSEESGGEGRQARDSTPDFVPTHPNSYEAHLAPLPTSPHTRLPSAPSR